MPSDQTRKEPRIAAVLPVRIYGMDAAGKPFNSVAHTLNVSKSGALLANVEVALSPGDLIGIQKAIYKGKFRVRWVGRKGSSSQGQIGIECIEGPRNMWGVDDRPHAEHQEIAAVRKRSSAEVPSQERRNAPRYPCDLGVQIGKHGSEIRMWSRCTDLSEGGCYVDTRAPLSHGAKFDLIVFDESEQIVIPSVVRTSFPGIGMGVEFVFDTPEEAAKLSFYLREKVIVRPPGSESPRTDIPAIEKLAEALSQLKIWAATAPLAAAEREELERFADRTCGDLLRLRSEFEARLLAADSQSKTEP